MCTGLLAICSTNSYAASLSLSTDTDVSSLTVGDTFSILLSFDDEGGGGLSGFGTHLSFDTSVIDYDQTIFNPDLALTSQGTENSGGFEVFNITGASTFPLFGSLITGSNTTVAEFVFNVVGAGVTAVNFSNAAGSFALTVAGPFDPPAALDPAAPFSVAVTGSPTIAPVPIPASMLLLTSCLAGLYGTARRRKT